jgi:hypothetical protein
MKKKAIVFLISDFVSDNDTYEHNLKIVSKF